MFTILIGFLSFVFLIVIIKDNPNTIQGKIKLFFIDVGNYIISRIKDAMKNKFFFVYFIYCVLIHLMYNYILPNILKEEYDIEQVKNDKMYYILFIFMIISATLIENGKFCSYDSIPFFFSNLIWLLFIIIILTINIALMVKNHSSEIINDVLYDFMKCKISFSNLLSDIYSLPFHIVFKSFSILKSESNLPVPIGYFGNLPACISFPLSIFYNIGIAPFEYLSNIYDLASSSYDI